jgi:tetratricopeptide (TPR) repeat protein
VRRPGRFLSLLCLAALGCAGPAATGLNLRHKAVSLNDAGYQYYRQSKWSLAQEKFAQALTLNRLIDDRAGIAANLNNLGAISQELGAQDRAQTYFKEALALYRGLKDAAGICESLNNLGTVYLAQGHLPEAEAAYREAESWARLLPPGPLLALSLTHLGDLARVRGDYGSALTLYQQALRLDEDGKDPRGQAVRGERLGRTYLALKDYPRAGGYLREALEQFRQLQDTNGIVDSLESLTQLALALGNRQEARIYGERLLKIYQARNQDREARELEALLAETSPPQSPASVKGVGGGGQGSHTPAPSPKPPPPSP